MRPFHRFDGSRQPLCGTGRATNAGAPKLAVSLPVALARLAVAHFVEQFLQPIREGAFRSEHLAEPLTDAVRDGAAGPRIQLDVVRGDATGHEKFRQRRSLAYLQVFKFENEDWLRAARDVVVHYCKF
jgi:hypothetical protein